MDPPHAPQYLHDTRIHKWGPAHAPWCVYPGALHHATAIQILLMRYVAVAQRPAGNQSNLYLPPTSPHHHGHEPPTDGGQLFGRGGALVECSPCPLRVLQGSTARRVSTNPKQYPNETAQWVDYRLIRPSNQNTGGCRCPY